jgi:DNA-binding NarL/FixJ family response regulator
LVLTRRTVQNHVSNIYAKLEVRSRMEAAYLAFRNGLAAPPESGD